MVCHIDDRYERALLPNGRLKTPEALEALNDDYGSDTSDSSNGSSSSDGSSSDNSSPNNSNPNNSNPNNSNPNNSSDILLQVVEVLGNLF
jgi:hypothetical protein